MEKVEEIDGEMSVALLDMSVPNPTVHVKFHFCYCKFVATKIRITMSTRLTWRFRFEIRMSTEHLLSKSWFIPNQSALSFRSVELP